ncbi:MAG: DUF5702 domain-containing protein [Clostridia bacterium]|nr:DUF5702 domain-containing protein [Clostridia bacterium]
MRFFQKTKGAISIFLCIVFMAVVMLTGVLVDGSRMRAAETEIKSALDTAAMSELSQYDKILKEFYGLFALADSSPDTLKQEIEASLNKILATELGMKKTEGNEKYYNALKKALVGEKESKPPFNLFDYRVENVKVTPLYNLSEPQVTRAQILEHMKYRAPKELAEQFLDKILAFKDFGRQSSLLKDKMGVDKQLNKVRESQENLSTQVGIVNDFKKSNTLKTQLESLANAFADRIAAERYLKQLQSEKAALEAEIKKVEEDIKKLEEEISKLPDEKKDTGTPTSGGSTTPAKGSTTGGSAKSGGTKATETKTPTEKDKKKAELETKKKELESKNTSLSSKNNSIDVQTRNIQKCVGEVISTKQKMVETINTYIFPISSSLGHIDEVIKKSEAANNSIDKINGKIKDDSSDFAESMRTDLGGKKKDIDREKLDKAKAALEENKKTLEEISALIAGITNDTIKETDVKTAGSDKNKILVEIKLNANLPYSKIDDCISKYNNVDYYVPKSTEEENKDKDPRDAAQQLIEDQKKQDEQAEQARKENDAKREKENPFPVDTLPSHSDKAIVKSEVKYKDILDKDSKEISKKTSEVKNTANGAKEFGDINSNKIKDPMQEANFKDDGEEEGFSEKALSMVSDFGARLAEGLKSMRDEMYVNEYIMGTFLNTLSEKTAEKDLGGDIKKESKDKQKRKTYFNDCEVEYIIGGDKSESANLTRVKAQILLVRFALNTLSIYTDPTKVNTAMQAAIAVAGWTGFGVPIVHTLIMLAWSMAESVLDVMFIMQGANVAIFKTKQTWVLGVGGGAKNAAEELKRVIANAAKQQAKEAADYTIDYATGKLKELKEKARLTAWETVENKMDTAINRVFQPVENKLFGAISNVDSKLNNFEDSLNAKANETVDDTISTIEKEIYNSTPKLFEEVKKDKEFKDINAFSNQLKTMEEEFFNQIKTMSHSEIEKLRKQVDDKEKAIKESLTNKIKDAKKNLKARVYNQLSGLIDRLDAAVDAKIDAAAKVGKDEVGKYIDSLGGTSKSGVTKNNIAGSLLSMNYQGYLRLFLMFTGSETKIKRIEDLIQLNMSKELNKKDFKLSDYNAYMRVEADVSMKYLFMTEAIIPKKYQTEDGRHRINIAVYKGY